MIDKSKVTAHRYDKIQGRGDPESSILLLGEKPGVDEFSSGRVFTGRAGVELEKVAWKTGIDLTKVWIDNLIADEATGDDNSVSDADIERNQAHIDDLLFNHKFKTIVTMGAVATRYMLNDGAGDSDVKCDLGTVHGVPHAIPWGTVFPVWHPAAGLHDGDAYPYIIHDFRLLAAFNKGWPGTERVDYIALAGAERYCPITASWSDISVMRFRIETSNAKYMFVDTEGTVVKPWCLSASLGEGEGWVIQTKDKVAITALADLVSEFGITVIMHYAPHDIPVLRAMGWDMVGRGVTILDTMVMAYLLGVEPQGLKNLAYRHCGMTMNNYIDIVTPYSTEMRVEWLIQLSLEEWGKPEVIVEEKKNETKVTQPQGLNQRINKILKDLSDDPSKVDIYKRWNDIHESVRLPAESVLGGLPMADLDDVDWETAWRYAARDADATGRVFNVLATKLVALDLWDTFIMDCGVIPHIEEMETTGFKTNPAYFAGLIIKWRGQQGRIRKSIAERIGRFINPESPKQVEKLLFSEMKLPAYKKTKSGADSTADKAIDWLKTSDKLTEAQRRMVIDIGDHRELDKGVTSFAQPIIEFAARDVLRDSRLHPNIKYTRVVSGRFSASEPNLLAIPVRSDLGKEIRSGFVAGDGHLLGSWDLNQIEMRFMAHESGDRALIKTYNNNGDVHRDTAADVFGVRVEDVQDEQRDSAKRVAFGVITGITGEGLHDQYMLNGIAKFSVADCAHQIDAWFDVHKEVKIYLEQCRAEARQHGYVRESVGGRIRYLQSVHSTSKKIMAEGERASHSHKISAGAQAILKKAMIALWPRIEELRRSDNVFIRWILQVHDELIFEFERGYEEILNPIITEALCTTTRLRVPIKSKSKFSENWGKLK